MNTRWFVDLCKREFDFLKDEFDFKMLKPNVSEGGVEIIFKNNTTGVRIWYEFREFSVFVFICQLLDDNCVVQSGEMYPDTELYCYDLEDLVAIRLPESTIPSSQSGTLSHIAAFESILGNQANNLANYAKDILRGDFSIFSQLDKVVKARAREAALRKWGEQASTYGW